MQYTPEMQLLQDPSTQMMNMLKKVKQDNTLAISRCKTAACRTNKKRQFDKYWKPAIHRQAILDDAMLCASKSCRTIRKKIKTVWAQTKNNYDAHCRPMRMEKSRKKCAAEKEVNLLKLVDKHTECVKSKCAAYKAFRKTIKK
jgi:hypothetical protein